MKLVSSWSDGKTLPESYIFPPGTRPGKHVVLTTKCVPVIDLSKVDGLDHTKMIQQIMEAAQEFGFFQVINHGLRKELLDDVRNAFKEFFDEGAEERAEFSLDTSKKCIVYTSNVDYDKEELHNWRDSLRLQCSPLEDCIGSWPDKPARFREVAAEYAIEAKGLGLRILDLICEGLGLEQGYFSDKLSQEQILAVHHYPPCPDPSLTIGTRKHCDPQVITILIQGDVPGLQVLKDGEWIALEAIPDALVVNIGHQLQMISNGKLQSVEHRAVTNEHETRITAALFIAPARNCLVEPASALINAENPPIYRGVLYEEFLNTFRSAYVGETGSVLEHYRI